MKTLNEIKDYAENALALRRRLCRNDLLGRRVTEEMIAHVERFTPSPELAAQLAAAKDKEAAHG